MKVFLAVLVLGCSTLSFAGKNLIYGLDNRKDIFEVTNPLFLKLAKATAAMVRVNTFQYTSVQKVFDIGGVNTLERAQNVCASEKFSEQPAAATCSGFLVGPDTLVTAGHCFKAFDLPENVCKNFVWVFDYHMKSATHDPTKNIPLENIYLCKKVIAAKLDTEVDYAVIKLDRKVLNREPLKFRTTGKVSSDAKLVVIGHPSGLPSKVSDDGKITRNTDLHKFSTNLDTFQGNSGSAVFDATTGVVEGILIQGRTDYLPSNPNQPESCKVVNRCDNDGNKCSAGYDFGAVAFGEVIFRITSTVTDIQASLKQ